MKQRSSWGSHRSDRTSPFTGGTSGDTGKVERPAAAEEDTSSESTSTNGRENRSCEDGPDAVVASPTSAEGGVLPVAVLTCDERPLSPMADLSEFTKLSPEKTEIGEPETPRRHLRRLK